MADPRWIDNKTKRYTPTDTLPLQHFYRCNMCGAVVIDKSQHDEFHKIILKLVNNG